MGWTQQHRAKAYAANKARVEEHDELVRPHFAEFRRSRISYQGMADTLQARDVPTPSGKGTWTSTMAKRIYDRLYFRCQKTTDLFG